MKSIIEIPGPVLDGKPRSPTIIITQHTTATVAWSINDLDVFGPPTDTFRHRIGEAGVLQAVTCWWNEHRREMSGFAHYMGGECYGKVSRIPKALAAPLAELIAGYYRKAIIGLPRSYSEMHEQLSVLRPAKKPCDVVPLDDESLQHAVQILAGLLASGHYTKVMPTGNGSEDPELRTCDVGKDWKESGFRRRRTIPAVEDAVMLLKDLRAELVASDPSGTPSIPSSPQTGQ